ncbi:MAG: thiolase domain-containing protein [Ardenticatenaceae bacterium]|nr:thiolase domain-containing protein [Ardenticatenaceae bacterium]
MREIAIVGVGQTPVGEHWDKGLRHLAVEAVLNALDDAHIKNAGALYVGNMLGGELAGQEHLGALVADYAGLTGIEAVKVEASCGSAAAALRQAVLAVASGEIDVAIAVGVEKLTELVSKCTTNYLAYAADGDYEASAGLSFVAINALLMQRYIWQYRVSKDEFGAFTVNAHANAVHNPNAMFRHPITREQYARAKMIADPINLLDSSPIADGAAAVVVAAADQAREFSRKPLRIAACSLGMDTLALDNRANPLWLKGVELSARKAYRTAGIGPGDVDLFELHDAFSIMAVLSLEASGFAEPGTALHLAHEGKITPQGELPICTLGGLKGRGHPVGATGLYQVVEAAIQLRGEAPAAVQVESARRAMAQNIGGSGATVITTILETMEGR